MCDRFAVHIFFFTLKQCSNSWSIILKFQRHCGDFSFEFGTLAVVFHLDLRPEDLLALTFHSCIHACIMLLFVLLEKFLLQNTTTTTVSKQSKFPLWFSTKCLWKNKWVVICAVFFLYIYCVIFESAQHYIPIVIPVFTQLEPTETTQWKNKLIGMSFQMENK